MTKIDWSDETINPLGHGCYGTGTKDKIIPKKEWIENIVNYCKEKNVPVFMKNNLKDIWQEPLIQEFPWRNK